MSPRLNPTIEARMSPLLPARVLTHVPLLPAQNSLRREARLRRTILGKARQRRLPSQSPLEEQGHR